VADPEPSQADAPEGVWVLLRLTDEGTPFLTLPENVTEDQVRLVRDFFRQLEVQSVPREPQDPEDSAED
jgi:hypothetical protein